MTAQDTTIWSRITDPDEAVSRLPAWFGAHMLAARGSFGLLLTTGDVLRISRLKALHVSSAGTVLLDVMLDLAGVPGGVDTAWQSKHYLGAPVAGANLATVNLASVVAAIEFVASDVAEMSNPMSKALPDELLPDMPLTMVTIPAASSV